MEGGDNGERRGRVIKDHVYRTHGQSQRGKGLRGVKESGGRKMETAVLEQQLKINTIKRIIFT